jgi:hypothetical protein
VFTDPISEDDVGKIDTLLEKADGLITHWTDEDFFWIGFVYASSNRFWLSSYLL